MQSLLQGKKALIMGVANKRSIAWGVAQSLVGAGASCAFTYQGDRLKAGVEELVATLTGSHLLLPCDVQNDAEIGAVAQSLTEQWGELDILVHSVAYANREELQGNYYDTSRAGYQLAHDISVYSLVAMTRAVLPLMEKAGGGSIVTMTYLGSERVVGTYNIMGVAKAALEASVRYLAADLGPKDIRVNAISAGPIRTLAASGVRGMVGLLGEVREKAPLRRNTEPAEVGDAALFLASHLARGITGEVIHVDSGYHILGV